MLSEDEVSRLLKEAIKPDSKEELAKADFIVALGFGVGLAKKDNPSEFYNPDNYFPGKSNEALAEVIAGICEGKKIFAQWEISEVLKEKGIECNLIVKSENKYNCTREVIDEMFENGLKDAKTVILVAHPDHIYRSLAITKKSAEKNCCTFKILIADTRDVPYDSESTQEWTKNRDLWLKQEVSSIEYYIKRGEM